MDITMINGNIYVHTRELAKKACVSHATIYTWRDAGYLEIVHPIGGRESYVTKATADRILQRNAWKKDK